MDELNEAEIAGACLASPDLCVHAILPHPAIEIDGAIEQGEKCPSKQSKLRIVRTARNLTAMNDAVEKGFWPLIRPVILDESIGNKIIVSQADDGIVHISNDFRDVVPGPRDKVYWHNPYRSPLPFAAYLIPADIKENERVELVDLIEDYAETGWNQGDRWRASSAEAVWTGETLEIEKPEVIEFLG